VPNFDRVSGPARGVRFHSFRQQPERPLLPRWRLGALAS
jgi:hypothetical protein